MNDSYLICRHTFAIQDLMDLYPPKLHNSKKKLVYRISCPTDSTSDGQLVFSRWNAIPLPEAFLPAEHQTKLEESEGYFEYKPSANSDRLEWYLNFAHSDLFCAYGGSLLAQDEMQVAEHPVLGSLREALLNKDIAPFTVENGQPTPILIRGAERRCAISTDPNPEKGRPNGLYGNNFARAKSEAIEQAVQLLKPPTITNIIAMEAPSGGFGLYQKEEIEYVLTTAFTGFCAANIESKLETNRESSAIVHTGFWGCGAYGGNRVLMALLQILAARLSRVNCLVFHTGGAAGSHDLAVAKQILDRWLDCESVEIRSNLIEEISQMGFQWGVSDGN